MNCQQPAFLAIEQMSDSVLKKGCVAITTASSVINNPVSSFYTEKSPEDSA